MLPSILAVRRGRPPRPRPGPVLGGARARAAGVPAAACSSGSCPGSRDLWDRLTPGRRSGPRRSRPPRRSCCWCCCSRWSAVVATRLRREPAAAPRRCAAAATRRRPRRTSTGPRAEAALREGRFDDALVEAFRALASRVAAARAGRGAGPALTAHELAADLDRRLPRPHADAPGRRGRRSSTSCSTATSGPTADDATGGARPRRGAAHGPAGRADAPSGPGPVTAVPR